MKKLLLLILTAAPTLLFAQKQAGKTKQPNNATAIKKVTPKQEKFEPISLWFVMLVKGANRTQDSATAVQLQAGHMANINKMAESGKLLVAGPFMEDANWRGIFILKCETKEEAESLVKQDPAVAAGRLSYEIHPWMTGKNCLFK